jgi:Tfp pilus assembly protein PilE
MELMVVIVIVAILAAVAVPLYINYVKDAQRTEAKGAIGAIITAEQTYYQVNGTYTDDTMAQNGAGQKLNCDLSEALNNWTITVSNSSATGFTASATGKANTPAKDRSVSLVYARNAQPQWTEN